MVKRKIKFSYSWVIIALMFLSVCLSLGFCSSGRSMYLKAITDALSIPRSAFSINNTIRFITATIVSLFFGTMVKKFGTKNLILAGFACLIGFAVINAYATKLWMFYIGSVLLGTGLSWTGTSMASKVVNVWCEKNKATITGAVLSANGLGAAIAIQIITPIIFEEGNPFGYQNSYKLVALIMVIMFVLLLVFYRNPPKGKQINTQKAKKKARGEGWVGMEYSEAVKKPYFYVLIVVLFLSGIILKGASDLSTPHYYDIGISETFLATVSSISSFVFIATKFFTGFFYDKFGIKFSVNLCFFSMLLSWILVFFIDTSVAGYSIICVRSLFGNLAVPLETVMLPILASDFFGEKSFDKMIGIYAAISYAGGAVGAPLGNLCYDILGSYKLAFAITLALSIVSLIGIQYVMKAAERDKKEILAQYE